MKVQKNKKIIFNINKDNSSPDSDLNNKKTQKKDSNNKNAKNNGGLDINKNPFIKTVNRRNKNNRK